MIAMRLPPWCAHPRLAAVVTGGMLLLLLSACDVATVGALPTATTPPTLVSTASSTLTPSPTATAAVPSGAALGLQRLTTELDENPPGGGVFTARAVCPAGSFLVSGGYEDPQSDPQQDSVTASYPASVTSWAVTAIDVGGPLTLTIYVDCAKPSVPVSPSVVAHTVNNTKSASVTCPAGTTVTGGGFKGSVSSRASGATATGWTSLTYSTSPSLSVYALCQGGGHVLSGSLPFMTQSVPNLGQSTVTVGCPSNQVLVGGGYNSSNGAAPFATFAAPDFSRWTAKAKFIGAPPQTGTVTAGAVCVKVV
jgi:hypothetical protein